MDIVTEFKKVCDYFDLPSFEVRKTKGKSFMDIEGNKAVFYISDSLAELTIDEMELLAEAQIVFKYDRRLFRLAVKQKDGSEPTEDQIKALYLATYPLQVGWKYKVLREQLPKKIFKRIIDIVTGVLITSIIADILYSSSVNVSIPVYNALRSISDGDIKGIGDEYKEQVSKAVLSLPRNYKVFLLLMEEYVKQTPSLELLVTAFNSAGLGFKMKYGGENLLIIE